MCVYSYVYEKFNADPLDVAISGYLQYVAIIVFSGCIIDITKTNPLGDSKRLYLSSCMSSLLVNK